MSLLIVRNGGLLRYKLLIPWYHHAWSLPLQFVMVVLCIFLVLHFRQYLVQNAPHTKSEVSSPWLLIYRAEIYRWTYLFSANPFWSGVFRNAWHQSASHDSTVHNIKLMLTLVHLIWVVYISLHFDITIVCQSLTWERNLTKSCICVCALCCICDVVRRCALRIQGHIRLAALGPSIYLLIDVCGYGNTTVHLAFRVFFIDGCKLKRTWLKV